MQRSILYLISGPAHIPYITVSLYTLRNHYDGDIIVYVWPESYEVMKRVGDDSRLRIDVRLRKPDYRGRNAQARDKVALLKETHGATNLYLDADTIIQGSLEELFVVAENHGFCVTQFNDWVSNNGHARKRVSALLEIEGIPQSLTWESMNGLHPSVNSGVLATQSNSPVFRDYLHWTDLARERVFIADETVLHAVCRKWEPMNYLHIMRGGAYNQSPITKFRSLPDEQVKIFHGHGDGWARPKKTMEGFNMWWPLYQECLSLNLGSMQEWKNQIGNKYLKECEEQQCNQ